EVSEQGGAAPRPLETPASAPRLNRAAPALCPSFRGPAGAVEAITRGREPPRGRDGAAGLELPVALAREVRALLERVEPGRGPDRFRGRPGLRHPAPRLLRARPEGGVQLGRHLVDGRIGGLALE